MNDLPPLSAGNASRSVTPATLAPGDIILSTTNAALSSSIQWATKSPVSHAMLYVGNGQVAEAVEQGVVVRSLQEALAEASLAVVYRDPEMTMGQALVAMAEAAQHEGAGYDMRGALTSPSSSICDRMDAEDEYFCSELVAQAYDAAGLPLSGESPACTTPADIAGVAEAGVLEYVGHLVTFESPDLDLTVGCGGEEGAMFIPRGCAGEIDYGGDDCQDADYSQPFHDGLDNRGYDLGYNSESDVVACDEGCDVESGAGNDASSESGEADACCFDSST